MMSAPWIPRPASNLPVRVASLAPETAEGKNARLTGAREGCPTRVGSWKISSPLFATHREHERCTSAFCRICDKVLSGPSNLQVWSEGSWRASLRPFNARGDHAVRMPIYCRICDKVLSEPIKLRIGLWKAPFRFFACIGTMNRSESPSTALRAPSPPLGEKDGMRGYGSWRERTPAAASGVLGAGRLYRARSRISRSSSVVSSIGLAFMLLAFKAAVTIDGSSLAVIP